MDDQAFSASIVSLSVMVEHPRSADAARLMRDLCLELGKRYGTEPSAFLPEEAMPPHGAFCRRAREWHGARLRSVSPSR